MKISESLREKKCFACGRAWPIGEAGIHSASARWIATRDLSTMCLLLLICAIPSDSLAAALCSTIFTGNPSSAIVQRFLDNGYHIEEQTSSSITVCPGPGSTPNSTHSAPTVVKPEPKPPSAPVSPIQASDSSTA